MVGRKYANPPILEAVCEFRLTPDTPWDITIPGLFYERVKETFSHREQRLVQEVEFKPEPQGAQQLIRTSERIWLFTPDRKTLVQLGPRLLAVSVLKPYPSWEGFKPHIEMAWKALGVVVEVKGIQRIGLRYINRIELPFRTVKVEDYFDFYPFVGLRLPQQMTSFIVVAEFPYAEGRDRCRVQLFTESVSEPQSAFILDIDYFLAYPRGIAVQNALQWVEEAHAQVEKVFEGCIKDLLREMFGGGEAA